MLRPQLPRGDFLDDRTLKREPLDRAAPDSSDPGDSPAFPVVHRGPAPLVLAMDLAAGSPAGADAVRLDLANLASHPCLVGVEIGAGRQADEPGDDCWFSGVLEPLDAGVRRPVLFPAEAMGRRGRPGDWAQAAVLRVLAAWPKDGVAEGGLSLALHGGHWLSRRVPLGPRLTREGLARAWPEPAWALPAESPLLRTDPPLPAPLEDPERIMRGEIMGRPVGFPPDWRCGGAPHQWLHLLHRHHFLRPLAREFARRPVPGLARAAALAVEDWIRRHPAPLDSCGGAGPAWETLSTAWRLREWLGLGAVMWSSPAFGDRTRSLMLRSIWEHARHLMDHRGHPTNWAMVEAAALALAGLRLAGFAEAASWARSGLARLAREVPRQFWPDGVHFELSPLYQAVCLEALLEVREAVLAAGQAFPPVMEEALDRGLGYLAALRRPDGTWPALNDSWGMDGSYGALLELSGRRPVRAGGLFPHGGVCVLGDGAGGPGGDRLLLRAGPAGAAHAHDDALSLDVSLGGRPFLVDPGISVYDPGPLADHYRSVRAHSMPWVEGWERRASRLAWRDRLVWGHGDLVHGRADGLEATAAVCWGPWSRPEKDCLIFRSVVLCPGGYFVVRDHFAGRGERLVQVRWQFAPGALRLEPGGRTARLSGPEGLVGGLTALGPGPAPDATLLEGVLDPPGGWAAVSGRDAPAACLVHALRAELPLTLVWLLWPGPAAPECLVLAAGDAPGAVRLELSLPGGVRDRLGLGAPVLAARSPGGLRLEKVEWERSCPDGRGLRLSLGGGMPAAGGGQAGGASAP